MTRLVALQPAEPKRSSESKPSLKLDKKPEFPTTVSSAEKNSRKAEEENKMIILSQLPLQSQSQSEVPSVKHASSAEKKSAPQESNVGRQKRLFHAMPEHPKPQSMIWAKRSKK